MSSIYSCQLHEVQSIGATIKLLLNRFILLLFNFGREYAPWSITHRPVTIHIITLILKSDLVKSCLSIPIVAVDEFFLYFVQSMAVVTLPCSVYHFQEGLLTETDVIGERYFRDWISVGFWTGMLYCYGFHIPWLWAIDHSYGSPTGLSKFIWA